MYCHFVPQTYQKSWHSVNGEKNVYYFDKNNYLEPLNENGGNLGKNFEIEDLYVLNSSDFDNGIEIVDVKKIEDDLSNKIENYWNGVKEQIEGLVLRAKNYEKNKGLCAFREEEVPPDITDKLLKFIIFQYIRIKKNFVEVDNGTTNLILCFLRKWYSQSLKWMSMN